MTRKPIMVEGKPFPQAEGGFTTICADPPWPYNTSKTGKFAMPKPLEDIGQVGVESMGFPIMELEEIQNLPIKQVIAKNAHLYLWTTNSFMEQAYAVARAWGFKPTTIITWVKVKKDDPTTPSMKTGYWFRGATEHCLFATRGSLPKPPIAIPTAFMHSRIAQHSAKPESFYTDIVETVSPGPYLELFSRTRREGWNVWGNQLPPRE